MNAVLIEEKHFLHAGLRVLLGSETALRPFSGAAETGQPLWLQMALHNAGPQPLRLLRWNTPFEGAWWGSFFTLWRQGRQLAYRGPRIKRAITAGEQDYLLLPAGSRCEAALELGRVFDLSRPGHYRLRPQLVLHDVRRAGAGPALPGAGWQALSLPVSPLQFSLAAPLG